MKVGDLVKWTGWKFPILIVGTEMLGKIGGGRQPYHRCLVSTSHEFGVRQDFIWLFEDQLELINESR